MNNNKTNSEPLPSRKEFKQQQEQKKTNVKVPTIRKDLKVDNKTNIYKWAWTASGVGKKKDYSTVNTLIWTVLFGAMIIYMIILLFQSFTDIPLTGIGGLISNIFQAILMMAIFAVIWYLNARLYPFAWIKLQYKGFKKSLKNGIKAGKQEYNENVPTDTAQYVPAVVIQKITPDMRNGYVYPITGFFGGTDYKYTPYSYHTTTSYIPAHYEDNSLDRADQKIQAAWSGTLIGGGTFFADWLLKPLSRILIWPFSMFSGYYNLVKTCLYIKKKQSQALMKQQNK